MPALVASVTVVHTNAVLTSHGPRKLGAVDVSCGLRLLRLTQDQFFCAAGSVIRCPHQVARAVCSFVTPRITGSRVAVRRASQQTAGGRTGVPVEVCTVRNYLLVFPYEKPDN